MRWIRAETQRDSELYMHDIYTHTLTRIDENMQEEVDAQLLRECRLGAAKKLYMHDIYTLSDAHR